MFTVYLLKHPKTNEIRYVGITRRSLSRRLSGHLYYARKGSHYPVHKWIRKLIAEDELPQIEAVDSTDSVSSENGWIEKYRRTGCRLLNCTAGGEGLFNPTDEIRAKISAKASMRRWSEEDKQRFSQSKKGKGLGRKLGPLSEETKARLRAVNLGKKHGPHSSEARAKMSAALKGRTHSEEARRKLAAANRGKKMSDEARTKMAEAQKRMLTRAILTEVNVSEARRLHATGRFTYTALGKRYGVGVCAMSNAIKGKTWTWVK